MLHIIWTGRGYLVAVFTFGFSFLANLLANCLTGSSAYWDAHHWPFALALLCSAIVCWPLGCYFHNLKSRTLVDPKTGEEVTLRNSHTFFFIPFRWWAFILATIALTLLALDLLGVKW